VFCCFVYFADFLMLRILVVLGMFVVFVVCFVALPVVCGRLLIGICLCFCFVICL